MVKQETILIVDDNRESLTLLHAILSEQGYLCYPADSGELALASLDDITPDLILLDVRMEGVGGYEVCQKIKEDKTLHSVPLIFLTSATDLSDKVEGFRLGAVDWITKPYQKEELLARVKTHLELFKTREMVKNQATQLQVLNIELQDSNQKLEQRVQERTKELQSSNQELEEFAYAIAHELRSPLRAIYGFSQMLVEDIGSLLDTESKRKFSVIQQNTTKMDQLIMDLLIMAKVSRTVLKIEQLDMKALINLAFESITKQGESSRIHLEIQIVPVCSGDKSLIKDVWIHLLDNAIKFSRIRDCVHIQIQGILQDKETIYSIKDNGCGFNQTYKSKIFVAFNRLHTDPDYEGTGIGLALVHRIIHRHGGRVWAEGVEGEGATFYFSLPNH